MNWMTMMADLIPPNLREWDTMLPLDDCKLISYRIGGR
jgi:hypothetical protein